MSEREAAAQEKFRRLRDRKDARDSAAARYGEREFDQARAEAAAANFRRDGEGADLGEIAAIGFKRGAANELAIFFEDEEMRVLLADLFLRARKQDTLCGVMRDDGMDRRSVGRAGAASSHDFFLRTARRRRASRSASRTASGAVPPEAPRRASEDSTVSAAEKSAPKAGEYFFSLSTGQAA